MFNVLLIMHVLVNTEVALRPWFTYDIWWCKPITARAYSMGYTVAYPGFDEQGAPSGRLVIEVISMFHDCAPGGGGYGAQSTNS